MADKVTLPFSFSETPVAGTRYAKKWLYKDYRRRAKKNEMVFDLTFDTFDLLTSQQCRYCGTEPSRNFKLVKDSSWQGKKRKRIVSCTYNGIDRINNLLGYTVANSAPCCWKCNKAKCQMGEQEFFQWAQDTHRWLELILKKLSNGR